MIAVRGLRDNPAMIILSGGALVATGAVVPWLELYGGLHQYAGITGMWGRVMLLAGLMIVGAAVFPAVRQQRRVGAGVLMGAIFIGALATTRLIETRGFVASPESAMLVPSVGPGLAIVLAGSVLAAIGGIFLSLRPRPATI